MVDNERLQLHEVTIKQKNLHKDELVENLADGLSKGKSFNELADELNTPPYKIRLIAKSYAYKNGKTLEDLFGDKYKEVSGREFATGIDERIKRAKSVIDYIKDDHTVKEASKEFGLTTLSIYKDIDWLSYLEPEYIAEYKAIADTHRFGLRESK